MVTSELLRPGLLAGVSVLLAGAEQAADPDVRLVPSVRDACVELGAAVWDCRPLADASPAVEEAAIEQEVDRVLAEAASIEQLVVDCAGLFAAAAAAAAAARSDDAADGGGRAALVTCLDATWNVTRAVVNRAFLARERAGRIVFLAPAVDAGEHADSATAGLENLARTLSVEWARHMITTVTVAPGKDTPAGEVAALTAYLASPAGAYFSGCLLDLRGPRGG
jgi:NAD(P)-dependent dehydrogenase (short-subunit alcohol dehydrogenase family)